MVTFDQLLNRMLGARFTTEAQDRNDELARQAEAEDEVLQQTED